MNNTDNFGYGSKQSQQGISVTEYNRQLEKALKELSEKNIGDTIMINSNNDMSSLIQNVNYFPMPKEHCSVIEVGCYSSKLNSSIFYDFK
ncbi:TPA: hypothetical protein KEY68_002711 [Providencia rettgeri]|uniref:hypothetical protein n=1 Tax=Providencia sp. PROV141 TaxID=2949851 RepID=UPI001B92A26E|nr:hypothetical protein [Providencia sp. PROV141]HBC7430430.1 hypothetical protein [Providencia rettgeri]